jgi:hypothetical protein
VVRISGTVTPMLAAEGTAWYPDDTMTFQTFATTIHARGMTLRSQLGGIKSDPLL